MHETPARKIRFLLHTNTMTIQTLAHEIGVTNEMLREVVDELSVPTPHLLQKICTFFGVKDDYFGEAPHAALAPQARPATKPPSAAVRPGLKSNAGPAPTASSPLRPAPRPTAPAHFAPARPPSAQAAAATPAQVALSQPSHRPSMAVRPGAPKRKRKVDLTEVALRQQALLDCLVQRELVFVNDYERRLIELRSKLKDRQKTV